MLRSWLLSLSLAGNWDGTHPPPTVHVSVDSSRHELTVTSGPYDLPNMPPMEDHAMMDLGMSHDTRLQRFEWPVDGWFRGFRVELVDGEGRPVPPHVMHHMIMVNFSRRQLLYSAAERLMGTGTETGEVSVPKTIGVPMKPGMKLGHVRRLAQRHRPGPGRSPPEAHHAVDSEESESPAGQCASYLHGREPDGGRPPTRSMCRRASRQRRTSSPCRSVGAC